VSEVNVSLEVREWVCFAAAHDVHFCFAWQPRESAPYLLEDMLSSLEDSSELFLLSPTSQLECSHWQDWAQALYQRLLVECLLQTLFCVDRSAVIPGHKLLIAVATCYLRKLVRSASNR